MSGETAISVQGLSKKYCKGLKRTMIYGMKDLFNDLCFLDRHQDVLRPEEFWALQDVSFDFRKGEWLGVVGSNGAGKSTLLKLLNGLIRPDVGRIEINGKIGGLIELGAGFHPLLTGRENVFIQAAIMGINRKEVLAKFDDIVNFAGIGDFIDSPVKFYSSGMHARLGFSVAIHFDPEIFVIDEVLAVGDIAFQEQCMRKMERLRSKDKAVLMVQQHTYWIEALCDRAIWLDKGKCVKVGKASEVVKAYLDYQDHRLILAAQGKLDKIPETTSTPASIEKVELIGESGEVTESFRAGERMTVRIHYNAHQRIEWPLFNIRIFNRGYGIMEASMLIDGPMVEYIEGRGTVECRLDSLPLTPKVYEMVIFARAKEGVTNILPMRTYAVFRISEENNNEWPMKGANGPQSFARGFTSLCQEIVAFSERKQRSHQLSIFQDKTILITGGTGSFGKKFTTLALNELAQRK